MSKVYEPETEEKRKLFLERLENYYKTLKPKQLTNSQMVDILKERIVELRKEIRILEEKDAIKERINGAKETLKLNEKLLAIFFNKMPTIGKLQ